MIGGFLKGKLSRVVFASVMLSLMIPASFVSVGWAWEVDATDRVTYVVDGDTFDASANGRIRLADIDAPEYYESGYSEAKYALTSLIGGKTVFLDIDDVTGEDRYGRQVCVVYVRHNATHVTNVNKALLDQGVATVTDFTNNEFNPGMWATYEYHPETSPPPTSPPTTAPPVSPPATPSPPSAPPPPSASSSPTALSIPYVLVALLVGALLTIFFVFVFRRREGDN